MKDINLSIEKRIMDIPQQMIDAVLSSDKIVVVGHKDPDLDCLGAQLGLSYALNLMGKEVITVNTGPFDNMLIKNLKKYFKTDYTGNFDLLVAVDTPNIDRLAICNNNLSVEKIVVVDHHLTNDKFGFVNWIEDYYISTCEMIYLLIKRLKLSIDKKTAQHLLNGILADNGYFRHIRNDKYFSLGIIHHLIENGADIKLGYDKLYGNRTLNSLRLLSVVIGRVRGYMDDRVLFAYLTDDDIKTYNANLDTSKVFEELLLINGLEVAIFIKYDASNELSKISLRSTGKVNVAAVAAKMGGGGHKLAAGAAVPMTIDKAENLVVTTIQSFLK